MSSVLANNISGKVVVITGGSSGLGETTARHLVSLGASVVLGARRIDKLEAIAADIRTAGGKVAVQATDVTCQDEVKAL
ncbi:MAG: SDR family NAD(P)-dependent oxidoreductase, partial [Pseudomonadota bacterium]|nr:SDR family NAD(P)-dependent oxidoreductase [Pseudomonadota bacterium]